MATRKRNKSVTNWLSALHAIKSCCRNSFAINRREIFEKRHINRSGMSVMEELGIIVMDKTKPTGRGKRCHYLWIYDGDINEDLAHKCIDHGSNKARRAKRKPEPEKDSQAPLFEKTDAISLEQIKDGDIFVSSEVVAAMKDPLNLESRIEELTRSIDNLCRLYNTCREYPDDICTFLKAKEVSIASGRNGFGLLAGFFEAMIGRPASTEPE